MFYRWHCCIRRLRDHEAVNLPADVHSAAVTRARKGPDRVSGCHGAGADERFSCRMITRSLNATVPVHVTVTATAPELSPKTWYGMPAYTNADGKVVVFFQDAGKFSYRYSTLGFQEAANLDDGDMWPVSYALREWSPVVEKRVIELVKAAIS